MASSFGQDGLSRTWRKAGRGPRHGRWTWEMDGNGEIQRFFQLTPFFFVELKKKKNVNVTECPEKNDPMIQLLPNF